MEPKEHISKKDWLFIAKLNQQFMDHCSGMTLADIAALMGSFCFGTLEMVASFADVDSKQYLADFIDVSKTGLEEMGKIGEEPVPPAA